MLTLGEPIKLMKTLPELSVDLIVTSPPFDGLKEYQKRMTQDYFKQLAEGMFRVVKIGGVVVWIVRDTPEDKSGVFKQVISFTECGFFLHDTMIHKRSFPLLSKVRYRQAFEYMFVLSKGKPTTIDLINDQVVKKVKSLRENIWNYTTGNEIMQSHLSAFPLALAVDHIKTWSKEGDVVFDPFLRSGTTGVAAMIMGRRFIGFEKEKKYFSLAEKRIANWETESIAVNEPCFSDDLYEAW